MLGTTRWACRHPGPRRSERGTARADGGPGLARLVLSGRGRDARVEEDQVRSRGTGRALLANVGEAHPWASAGPGRCEASSLADPEEPDPVLVVSRGAEVGIVVP